MSNVSIEYNKMKYIFDSRLSLKAKGLMAMMVSYIYENQPSVFHLDDVMDLCCDGRVAFKNALTELEQYGYLVKSLGKAGFVKGSSPWTFILRE